jgi:uncharacterized Zn finger protein
MNKDMINRFKKLTWDDLENWAGNRILNRGENYFKKGLAKNIRVAPEGILANVLGTSHYITFVSFEGKSKNSLTSKCTCPYGWDCKHAIALILTFLDMYKNKKSIKTIDDNDPDLLILKRTYEDSNEYYDELGNTIFEDITGEKKSDLIIELKSYLQEKNKTKLIDLVVELSDKYCEVREELFDRIRLSSGNSQKIVSSIKVEIRSIMSEPSWENHWSGEGNLADFSRVENTMSTLFKNKEYDSVVEIMKELINLSGSYVETCDDDGDSTSQISACVGIGFEALKKSNLSDLEKVNIALDAELADDYGIFEEATKVLKNVSDKGVWSEVSKQFRARIDKLSAMEDGFSSNYQRDKLSNYLIMALNKAGKSGEVLLLCEKEAKITNSWVRYVECLIQNKKIDLARKAAEEGIKCLKGHEAGTVAVLREKTAWIDEKEGDFSSILLLRQEQFLERPSLSTFKELLKISVKTKNKVEMRKWALDFLLKGRAKKKGSIKKEYIAKESYYQTFPAYDILIDIAEKEKRVDDIYNLYIKSKKSKRRYHFHDQVAYIISEKYPDEALSIWKLMAEDQIAITKPSAYERSLLYLKRVRKIYLKMKRENEWVEYITDLREVNKRKTRFIQTIRRLTKDTIIS